MMHTVLVEDEPRILKDLRNLLDKHPQVNVLGCAENGAEALALLEHCTSAPDLLITDIRMQGMDGLELIRRAKQLYPSLECIILSGYSDFNYARSAITLGVREYFLKPVKTQELFTALDAISARATRAHLEKIANTEQIIDAPDKTVETLNAAVLVCVGGYPIHMVYNRDRADFWESINLEQLAQEHVPGAQCWVMQGKTPVERNMVFSFSSQTLRSVQQTIKKFFDLLCQQGAPITMGVKTDFGSLYSVGPHARMLRRLLRTRTVPGLSQMLEIDDTYPQESIQQFEAVAEEVMQLLKRKKNESVCALVEKTVNKMEEKQLPQEFVWQFFSNLLERCCLFLEVPYSASIENDLADALLVSEQYSVLARNLSGLFEELLLSSSSVHDTVNTQEHTMQLIDEYIRQNYHQQINTQVLADKFFLTPAYLSKVFRAYKQQSPVEYIAYLRVEQARHLLETDDTLNVKDVALMVGYEDPFYFSKVFKKLTGHAPKAHIRTE